MFRRVLILLCVFVGAGPGCANPPRFVKNSDRLSRWFYRPPNSPHIYSDRIFFEISRKWKGPETNALGEVRYVHPKGRAFIIAAWYANGSADWMPPVKYRQYMREQGTVSDSHMLEEIVVSSRTASRAVFTDIEYDPERVLGAKSKSTRIEIVMVPDAAGLYVFRYESSTRLFRRYRRVFAEVLKTAILADTATERTRAEEGQEFSFGKFGGGKKGSVLEERKKIIMIELEKEKEKKKRRKQRKFLGIF